MSTPYYSKSFTSGISALSFFPLQKKYTWTQEIWMQLHKCTSFQRNKGKYIAFLAHKILGGKKLPYICNKNQQYSYLNIIK